MVFSGLFVWFLLLYATGFVNSVVYCLLCIACMVSVWNFELLVRLVIVFCGWVLCSLGCFDLDFVGLLL